MRSWTRQVRNLPEQRWMPIVAPIGVGKVVKRRRTAEQRPEMSGWMDVNEEMRQKKVCCASKQGKIETLECPSPVEPDCSPATSAPISK